MSRYIVEGGRRIGGELSVHGAKNSVLPILAASMLTREATLHNCPLLSDVTAACEILSYLGCGIERDGGVITVKPGGFERYSIPDNLMREMRSSVVFLGAIIARCGKARISMPGGCEALWTQ